MPVEEADEESFAKENRDSFLSTTSISLVIDEGICLMDKSS